MDTTLLSPSAWAEREFARADLGHRSRSRRLVRVAGRLAASPGATLCAAIPAWSELKAAYALMGNPGVSHAAVLADHVRRTRERCAGLAAGGAACLLVEDTTALDFSAHPAAAGLGRIGDDGGRGFYVHTTLAVVMHPDAEAPGGTGRASAELVGLFDQRWWARRPPSPGGGAAGERKAGRLARDRESQRWAACLDDVAPPPPPPPPPPGPGRWTFVADRESDVYEVLARCRRSGVSPLIRACQNRACVRAGADRHVFDAVRAAPPRGTYELHLRARPGHAARVATVQVRSAAVTLRPPWRPADPRRPGLEPIGVNVIEAWEPAPPAGTDPLHWVLLTDWPAATFADGRRAVAAYGLRFLIEDYHKGLKTGCGMETSQLATIHGLTTLLGVIGLLAARLLDMKLLARARPDAPVTREQIAPAALVVLAAKVGEPAGGWTNRTTVRAIARLGGFLGRNGDGEPGWITLWRGGLRLMALCEGYALAESG